MYVWFAAARLVQAFHRGGVDDAYRDVLRNGCFAVSLGSGAEADVILHAHFSIVDLDSFIEIVEVIGLGAGTCKASIAETAGCAAGAGEGVGDDCEGEEGDVVFFC